LIQMKRGTDLLSRYAATLAFAAALAAASSPHTAAQEQARHTLELGVTGQTTENLVSAPYTVVYGIGSATYIGTPHEQAFAGPQLGYRYALTRNFSLVARAEYLFGHQPTVARSGGNELLLHAGIRASAPIGRFTFFASVAPGLSSFSSANRFIHPGSTPYYQQARITHFSLEKSAGITYPLGPHTALSFSVSELTLVEGDVQEGYVPPTPQPCDICGLGGESIYPGNIEEHLVANISIERSFGHAFPQQTGHTANSDAPFRNQFLFLWANQPQNYLLLSQDDLVTSNGFGVAAAHSLKHWLDLDASWMIFPGGDSATYQDGGSQQEVFAGVKGGLRRRYYGVFAKVRPGLVTSPDTINSALTANPPYVRNYNFAADAGAVLEIYPRASHFVLRLDLGEVLTHYAAVKVAIPGGYATEPAQDKDAGLFTLGVGWRF
jgi:hypothetical protein